MRKIYFFMIGNYRAKISLIDYIMHSTAYFEIFIYFDIGNIYNKIISDNTTVFLVDVFL